MSQNKNLYRLFLLLSCLAAMGLFIAPYLQISFQPLNEAVPGKMSFAQNIPGFRLLSGGDLASFASSSAPLSSSSQNPVEILQDLPAGAVMLEKFPWAALTCLPALVGIFLAMIASSEMLTEYAVYLTGINVMILCTLMVPFTTIMQNAQTPTLITNLQYSMHYRVAWGLYGQFGVALLQLAVAINQYYYQRVKSARDKKMRLARFQFKKTSIKCQTKNNPALAPTPSAPNPSPAEAPLTDPYADGASSIANPIPSVSFSSPAGSSPLVHTNPAFMNMNPSMQAKPFGQAKLAPTAYSSSIDLAGAEGEFAPQKISDFGPDGGEEEPFRLALAHEDNFATELVGGGSQVNQQKGKTFLAIDNGSSSQQMPALGSQRPVSAIQQAITQGSATPGSIAQGHAVQGSSFQNASRPASAIQQAIAQGSAGQGSPSQGSPTQALPAQPMMPMGSAQPMNPVPPVGPMSTFASQRRQSKQKGQERSNLAILRQTQLSKTLADEAAKAASEIKLQDETVKGMRMEETLSGPDTMGLSNGESLQESFLPGSKRSGEGRTVQKPIGSYAMIDMDGATAANEIFLEAGIRPLQADQDTLAQVASQSVQEKTPSESLDQGEGETVKKPEMELAKKGSGSAKEDTQAETKSLAKAGPGVHKKW